MVDIKPGFWKPQANSSLVNLRYIGLVYMFVGRVIIVILVRITADLFEIHLHFRYMFRWE